jgi:hypothetical protein
MSGGQLSCGSPPALTLSQTPSAPDPLAAKEHALQVALHAESQHTESTQYPDWHSAPAKHGAPTPSFGTHAPVPSQKLPVVQSAFDTQGSRHASDWHT